VKSIEAIEAEYKRARQKWPPLKSAHEGYAVFLEEAEEMWHEIKHGTKENARMEAIQTGAMIVALLEEVLC